MIFTYRYCRMLEEGSFRSRTADFVMMFLFGATLMIVSFFVIFFLDLKNIYFKLLKNIISLCKVLKI